jgi:hypothetical protein
LNKLLIVAVLMIPLAVECVRFAATPSYREYWDSKKAHVDYTCTGRGNPSATTEIWVCWQKTGFSVFTKGKEDIFEGVIPRLDCTAPLSEAVFALLQDEIRTIAKLKRDNSLSGMSWSMWYFVIDSTDRRSFIKGLCTPEVVSLEEDRYYFIDWAMIPSIGVLGRNFIWHDSSMMEIELEDLFEKSPGREWFAVLAKKVEDDLRRQKAAFLDDRLPFEKFDQFLITAEGLKIIFQPYEIDTGPFCYFVEVVVSWDLMSPFLKPGAPVTIWYEKQLQKR